jgi:hypothetical protein
MLRQKLQNKKLENYGHQGHGGGWITSHLQGKTIGQLEKDGEYLIVRMADGHVAYIGWQDASGNQLKGEPFLERLDVQIQIAT